MKMNTKFVKVVFIAAIVLMGGVNFVNTQSVVKLSDVAMDNVEALADNEGLKPGNYDVYDEVTTFSVDGNPYKKTIVRNCEDGGKYECREGNYYCYKKDSGEWSEWIPS